LYIWRDQSMSGLVLTLPIAASKVEAWRRFCQEISGSRLQMYITSRRNLGITAERMALVENGFGATAVTTLEAFDVAQLLSRIISSKLPFDRWYRNRIQELHGINLAGYGQFSQPAPLPDEHELLFEWTMDSNNPKEN
jgi:hypothetical protein